MANFTACLSPKLLGTLAIRYPRFIEVGERPFHGRTGRPRSGIERNTGEVRLGNRNKFFCRPQLARRGLRRRVFQANREQIDGSHIEAIRYKTKVVDFRRSNAVVARYCLADARIRTESAPSPRLWLKMPGRRQVVRRRPCRPDARSPTIGLHPRELWQIIFHLGSA